MHHVYGQAGDLRAAPGMSEEERIRLRQERFGVIRRSPSRTPSPPRRRRKSAMRQAHSAATGARVSWADVRDIDGDIPMMVVESSPDRVPRSRSTRGRPRHQGQGSASSSQLPQAQRSMPKQQPQAQERRMSQQPPQAQGSMPQQQPRQQQPQAQCSRRRSSTQPQARFGRPSIPTQPPARAEDVWDRRAGDVERRYGFGPSADIVQLCAGEQSALMVGSVASASSLHDPMMTP